MKKRKRIFLTMLTTILTFLGVLLGINNAPKVEAATSPYLNIRYETYLLEDYLKMEKWNAKWQYWQDDLANWISAADDTAQNNWASGTYYESDLKTYTANNINRYWAVTTVSANNVSKGDPTKTKQEYYASVLGCNKTDLPTPLSVYTKLSSTFSYDFDDATGEYTLSYPEPKPTLTQTTTFNPGDEIVIVEYVKGDTEYKDTAICYDLEFLDGTQTLPLTKAKTKAASLPSSFSTTDFYVWENSAYGNKYNTVVNATGTFYDTTGSSIATKSAFKGGGGSSDTSTYKTEDVAFAIGFKIDSGANGNYKIKPASTDESKYIPNISNATGFKFVTNSDHFNITPLTITVAGASNATGLSSITLGGNAATPSTVTNISGTTNGSTSGTKPAGSHIGTSNYATFTSTAGSSASSIDLVAAVDGRGTITSVKYGTSASAA